MRRSSCAPRRSISTSRRFFAKWLVDLTRRASPPTEPFRRSRRCRRQLPIMRGDGGPAWADAIVICPWTIYRCCGDRRILERHYAAMKAFVDNIETRFPTSDSGRCGRRAVAGFRRLACYRRCGDRRCPVRQHAEGPDRHGLLLLQRETVGADRRRAGQRVRTRALRRSRAAHPRGIQAAIRHRRGTARQRDADRVRAGAAFRSARPQRNGAGGARRSCATSRRAAITCRPASSARHTCCRC